MKLSAVCIAVLFAAPCSLAQVITDGTLGARATLAGPNFTVVPSLGRVAGSNLFHSFATLTIRSGQSITFLSDSSIQNVISRVTGGQPSIVDGQIRSAAANVNVFLLNPAGVFFGPASSLNVAASFYASTADYVRFADGSRFNSLPYDDGVTSLPAVAPVGFGFLGPTATIQLTGSQLRVTEGRTLGLVAGNLALTNQGTRVSLLSAPGGSIAAVASGGSGEVLLNGRYQSGAPSGRLDILGGTLVSVSESSANRGSGRIVIRGGDVYIDHSRVLAQTRSGDGGEIDVAATSLLSLKATELNGATTGKGNAAHVTLAGGDLLLEESSAVDTSCEVGCTGRGGDIDLKATRSIVMRSSADAPPLYVASNTLGSGASGKVSVNAPLLMMMGNSNLQAAAVGAGNSSGIAVSVANLVLMNGGQILTSTQRSGRGGLLTVNASDNITISGERLEGPNQLSRPSGLFSNSDGLNALSLASGNAGSIVIAARHLHVLAGGQISSSATRNSTGNAGDVSITVSGDVRVSGTAATSAFRRSTITSNTLSSGRGGQVSIIADRLLLDSSGTVQTQSELPGGSNFIGGAAGAIVVRAGEVLISSGAQVSSDTGTQGNAGTVDMVASRRVVITGSPGLVTGVFSNTRLSGNGGAISIKAPEILLRDQGRIRTATNGSGDAGAIFLDATKILTLRGGSVVDAVSDSGGDAGNITVRAQEGIELNDSAISTTARSSDGGNIFVSTAGSLTLTNGRIATEVGTGVGNGGNIAIDSSLLLLRNSTISANAFGGDGGNIQIASKNVLSDTSSSVTASSQLGIDGTVQFESPAADLSGALFSVNSSFLDANAVLAARCVGPNEGARTRLAMRLFDADHRVESGFLFPQASAPLSRSVALAVIASLAQP